MSEENTQKFLIITSDTGGGHASAATAIADGLKRFAAPDCLVNIARAIEESHLLAEKLTELYNYLLRHHQHLMKYYYWAIERFRPNESSLFYRMTSRYVRQLFERYCPQVIVSVHPMTQHFLGRMLRELGLLDRIPLVTVVTDPCYGFWRGWACEDVSLYLVATEEARQQLIDFGVPEERIKICGIPIHPKFQYQSEEERTAARLELGLAPDKFTMFINAGWVGGGNIPHIFERMVEYGEQIRNTQAIFLAGRNEKLREQVTAVAQRAAFPTHVIGYSNAMEKLMNAADVMISKLGGLTTFEALASRLPIIADTTTPPMPQESQTANLISRHNAGLRLERATDVVPIIRRLMHNPVEHAAMRLAASHIAIPDATKRIVDELMRKMEERSAIQHPELSARDYPKGN
ncbi:MAG TPA: glycosyltransferase [Blastocatellia bacterium]|nr:glycosyltransferase [Blastocatellia bacterium]